MKEKKKDHLIKEACIVEFFAFKLKDWEKFLEDKSPDEIKEIRKRLEEEKNLRQKELRERRISLGNLQKYLRKQEEAEINLGKIVDITKEEAVIDHNFQHQEKVIQKTYHRKNKKAV